jgi:hypothetical protein
MYVAKGRRGEGTKGRRGDGATGRRGFSSRLKDGIFAELHATGLARFNNNGNNNNDNSDNDNDNDNNNNNGRLGGKRGRGEVSRPMPWTEAVVGGGTAEIKEDWKKRQPSSYSHFHRAKGAPLLGLRVERREERKREKVGYGRDRGAEKRLSGGKLAGDERGAAAPSRRKEAEACSGP